MNRPAAASVAVLILALAVVVAGSSSGLGATATPSGSSGAAEVSASPTPLGSGAIAHRPREVFGFLPYWSMADWTDRYLRYDLLTTIAFFGVGVRDSGALNRSAPGYTAFMSERATTIIGHAHAAGVRVVITFESFGSGHNHRFLSNPAARGRFVSEASALVAERGIDGTNLDVEGLASADFADFGLLVGATADAFHGVDPASEVSASTNGNVSGARMARVAVAAGADRAFLMGYSYRVASTVTTGSVAPITGVGSALDLVASLDLYAAAGVPPEQVILGLPYFGMTWPTVTGDLHSSRQPDAARLGSGRAFRPSSVAAAGPPPGSTLDHDPIEGSARYTWYDRTQGTWFQTYFEDPSTLTPKEGLAIQRGLAGIGLWALGDDRGAPGYWETVAATLGLGPPYVAPSSSPSPPGSPSPAAPPVTASPPSATAPLTPSATPLAAPPATARPAAGRTALPRPTVAPTPSPTPYQNGPSARS
jgi:spore germination protein YaaH